MYIISNKKYYFKILFFHLYNIMSNEINNKVISNKEKDLTKIGRHVWKKVLWNIS